MPNRVNSTALFYFSPAFNLYETYSSYRAHEASKDLGKKKQSRYTPHLLRSTIFSNTAAPQNVEV